MKKRFSLVLIVAMIVALLAACGKKEETNAPVETEATTTDTKDAETEASDGTEYKIGVIQYVQHVALDSSYEGFIKALDDAGIKYVVDFQNASGEQSACDTISTKLVNDENDLILAIATPAAQAVAGKTSDVPILVTAVTDPASAGLVESNEKVGGNVSGTSDLTPIKEQMELIRTMFPEAKKVGILYCSAEQNSVFQADIAKAQLDSMNIEWEEFTVSSTNEVQQVVESMAGKVDVGYTPTDNLIASSMATVAMVGNDNGIPFVVGEAGMCSEGGLATYGIDYFNLGYKTGAMAVKILKGEVNIAETAIEYLASEECELVINKTTAELFNISLDAFADATLID